MSVGEYTCNSQMSEGSESTLLVAFLHNTLMHKLTIETKSQVKCTEM